MNKKSFFKTTLIGLIIIAVISIFYYSRQIFYFQYEPEYYENLYYYSQWNIPNSTRGISDGTLYKFVGYQLVEGENPFNINYEVPPLGKYLYGLSSKILGNPYWISIGLYLVSIGVLFYFSRDLFKNKITVLLSLLLFVTTPFVATQIRETMLDLPMMVFYLIHTWFFIKFLHKREFVYLVTSGVFLGLATGVKPGIYTPFVGFFGVIILFLLKNKWLLNIFSYTLSVFFGYILSFFCYFIRHPNPIPWIRLHKKSFDFHLSSQIKADYLNQWKSIFLNTYQGWWQPGKTIQMGDWSLIIPIGVVLAVVFFILSIIRKKTDWVYISGLALIFLGVNTLIPFWPRYLMPVIPLFILLITKLFNKSKIRWILLLLVVFNLPFLKSSIVRIDPIGDINALARFFSTRAYRELYRSIDFDQRKILPEDEFIKITEGFFSTLGTRRIDFKVTDIVYNNKKAKVNAQVYYKTKYGEIEETKEFNYIRTRNQWKLDWDWDYLLDGFNSETGLKIIDDTIPFYQLVANQKEVIAERGPWKMVYVIPRLMYDWNKHLNRLSEVTGMPTLEVDKQIRRFVPSDFPRFVGYLDPSLGKSGIKMANDIKGVVLKDIDYAVIPPEAENNDWPMREIKRLTEDRPKIFYVRAKETNIQLPDLPEGNIVINAK
jgi:hypothetical protein